MKSESGAEGVLYESSSLTFKRDVIEPLRANFRFTCKCPIGCFTMTKAYFYREFANVGRSKAYYELGLHKYEAMPE